MDVPLNNLMTAEMRLERVGMAELLGADDAHVGECVLVDALMSLQIPIVGEVRPARVALVRLLAGVDAPMRMHALEVIEGGAAKVAQVRAHLEAAAQVTQQTVLLRESLATTVARMHVNVRVDHGMPLNSRQTVGVKLAAGERAREDSAGTVRCDGVSLVVDRVTERRGAVGAWERLRRVAAGMTGQSTQPGTYFAADLARDRSGFDSLLCQDVLLQRSRGPHLRRFRC